MHQTNSLERQCFIDENLEVYLWDNFLKNRESEILFKTFERKVEWEQEQIILFGKPILSPRLSAWYSYDKLRYSYSGKAMIGLPFFAELEALKNKVEKFLNYSFNSVLLNFYRKGSDSMGLHQDNEKELGRNPVIASVSLGGARMFRMKKIDKTPPSTISFLLKPGSLLLMGGKTQHYWKHELPKTKKNVMPRINLTFRQIIQ